MYIHIHKHFCYITVNFILDGVEPKGLCIQDVCIALYHEFGAWSFLIRFGHAFPS